VQWACNIALSVVSARQPTLEPRERTMTSLRKFCPWCRSKKALTKAGVFRYHNDAPGRNHPCRGSQRAPEEAVRTFKIYEAACSAQDKK